MNLEIPRLGGVEGWIIAVGLLIAIIGIAQHEPTWMLRLLRFAAIGAVFGTWVFFLVSNQNERMGAALVLFAVWVIITPIQTRLRMRLATNGPRR